MKKCPFCAEEIQDDAIFCRYCHNDISKTPPLPFKKNIDPKIMFILDMLGTPTGILITYFSISIAIYLLDIKFTSTSTIVQAISCISFVAIYFIAFNIRRKYISDRQKEEEDKTIDYWRDRGH